MLYRDDMRGRGLHRTLRRSLPELLLLFRRELWRNIRRIWHMRHSRRTHRPLLVRRRPRARWRLGTWVWLPRRREGMVVVMMVVWRTLRRTLALACTDRTNSLHLLHLALYSLALHDLVLGLLRKRKLLLVHPELVLARLLALLLACCCCCRRGLHLGLFALLRRPLLLSLASTRPRLAFFPLRHLGLIPAVLLILRTRSRLAAPLSTLDPFWIPHKLRRPDLLVPSSPLHLPFMIAHHSCIVSWWASPWRYDPGPDLALWRAHDVQRLGLGLRRDTQVRMSGGLLGLHLLRIEPLTFAFAVITLDGG